MWQVNTAKISSISGRGTASSFVIAFSWWKSMQNLCPPSFFSTITIGKLQGDLDLSIIPESIISFIASSTNFLLWIGVLYGLNLTGGWSPVSILISTIFVCPSSLLVITITSRLLLSKPFNLLQYLSGNVMSSSLNSLTSVSSPHFILMVLLAELFRSRVRSLIPSLMSYTLSLFPYCYHTRP